MHNPLAQFTVKPLIDIKIFGYDISFTNSSLFMCVTLLIICIMCLLQGRKGRVVPGRIQMINELVYDMVVNMVDSTSGKNGLPYVPFILSLYLFILLCNLSGMLPGAFTVTSHITITFALAIFIFCSVTILGFIKHGLHYLKLFLPEGTPIVLMPLMFIIELFAYLARPVSLSLRLAANMTAGHIILKVIASFVIMAGFVGIFPFALLVVLDGFEIFIALLQAYIFSILTCVYLSDALNLHE